MFKFKFKFKRTHVHNFKIQTMNTRMLLLASVALFALASAKDAARTQNQAVLSVLSDEKKKKKKKEEKKKVFPFAAL